MKSGCTYRETVLRISDLSFSRGERPVLRGVNVEIRDIVGHGQVVALLGPSGVGKTTLLRLLSGLEPLQQGRIEVYSRSDAGMKELAPGMVGVVSQHYPLFRHRTVLGNLLLAPSVKGEDGGELCRAYLARFGLEKEAELYPVQLSGGQRQRVAIIQQLLCSDNFILMDEPFSGLDPLMKENVCRMIREVAALDELNTVIVVTHGVEEALMVSDTLWMLGRERDGEGNQLPGASIRTTYDLAAEGLAWRDDVDGSPRFAEFARTVREQYRML